MPFDKRAVEEILEHPLVEAVSTDNFMKDVKWGRNTTKHDLPPDMVSVYTAPLKLHNNNNKNYRRLLPRAKIGLFTPKKVTYADKEYFSLSPYVAWEVELDSGKYEFWYEGFFHVHVFSSGQFCIGGPEPQVLGKMVSNNLLLGAADFAIDFLQQRKHGYGRPYPHMAKMPLQKKTKAGWRKIKAVDDPNVGINL